MAAPMARGIENNTPGDPAIGRTVPQLAQESAHTPNWPPMASGTTKPTITPIAKAVTHFISG